MRLQRNRKVRVLEPEAFECVGRPRELVLVAKRARYLEILAVRFFNDSAIDQERAFELTQLAVSIGDSQDSVERDRERRVLLLEHFEVANDRIRFAAVDAHVQQHVGRGLQDAQVEILLVLVKERAELSVCRFVLVVIEERLAEVIELIRRGLIGVGAFGSERQDGERIRGEVRVAFRV